MLFVHGSASSTYAWTLVCKMRRVGLEAISIGSLVYLSLRPAAGCLCRKKAAPASLHATKRACADWWRQRRESRGELGAVAGGPLGGREHPGGADAVGRHPHWGGTPMECKGLERVELDWE